MPLVTHTEHNGDLFFFNILKPCIGKKQIFALTFVLLLHFDQNSNFVTRYESLVGKDTF